MPIGYGQEIWKSSIVSRAQTGWLVTLVGFLNPPPLQNLGGVVWQNISVISCPNRVRVSNHKRNVTEESRQSLSVFFSEGLFSIYLILLWKSMNGSIVFAFATLGDVFPEIHIHPALPHCTCINRVGLLSIQSRRYGGGQKGFLPDSRSHLLFIQPPSSPLRLSLVSV